MNEENNNIFEYHCSCCRYRQQNEDIVYSPINHQGTFLDKDERICKKCGIKQNKVFMNKFADGTVICSLGGCAF